MTTSTHTSHDDLAVAARAGDDHAFRLLVERFRPMVRAMARERFIPGGDHDDLVQEGMVGLWHAIRDFNPAAGPFGPFARLCVDRQMWAAVTKANRYRHRVLHDASVYEDWMDIAVSEEELTKEADCVSHLTGKTGGACELQGAEADTMLPGEM